MQIGIFAKTFAVQGAEPVLAAARGAGYSCVQFNMACLGLPSMPDEISAETAQSIADASRATGIKIAAVSGTYNMIHPDKAKREEGLRRLEVMIKAATAMGTNLVTLCTGSRDAEDQWRHHADNQSADAWRDLMVEMSKAASFAETHAVDLGIEPELANIVCNAHAAVRLVKEIGSARIRIVLDPANLFEVATDAERRDIIARAVDLLGDRIVMAHAKDRDPTGSFVAAGTGVIDFQHFVHSLKSAGFNGPLITHGLEESDAPSVAAFLKGIVGA
jgi:sugar phosphate isomerase/epimerase